ncbi:glycosyltransferase family 2 protein [Amylibacter sp.]|nr:glycosyltransferase family 2 protein [Amylibacter sp.]
MSIYTPKVTVITPTWNRGPYLDRVWLSLCGQTYDNFEWIICDDGSTDNTAERVQFFLENSDFPITVVVASLHVGKVRLDNEAVALADSEYTIWCDSDDYLLPDAIFDLVEIVRSIEDNIRQSFIGVTALCATENGAIVSTALPSDVSYDTTWNSLVTNENVQGDMIYMCQTSALKSNPFPEVDFVMPESIVWNVLGEAPARVKPVVVKINEYNTPNAISFSGKMEYNRGRAYSLATTFRYLKKYDKSILQTFWKIILYCRYCIHGEISLRNKINLWKGNTPFLTLALATIIAFIFALKDKMQRKVVYTHRSFQRANKLVKFTIKSNSKNL